MMKNTKPDKTQSQENREKENNGGSEVNTETGFSRFKKIITGPDLGLNEEESENAKSQGKTTPKRKTAPQKGHDSEVEEFPELNLKKGMMNFKVTKFFQSNKTNIIKYTATTVGVIFLLSGIILLSTAATRVVDNVIFGERTMFSSFLILVGILILITVFGRRYWADTVLKKLNVEMEISDGKSKSENKDKKPQKSTQKSNIDDENKSN